MKHLFSSKLLIAIAAIVFYGQDLSAQRGQDYSPDPVQKKYYQWGKKVKEFKGLFKPPVEDRWFNKYTEPLPGHVVIHKTGERINGTIVVRHRWNKASKKFVKDDAGNLTRHPGGVDVIEDVKIAVEGKSTTYSTKELFTWGFDFKMSDWAPKKNSKNPADNYQKGGVTLESGEELPGYVCMIGNTKKALPRYYRFFYAPNPQAPVIIYFDNSLNEAYQEMDNREVRYILFNHEGRWLINQDSWTELLLDKPQKLDYQTGGMGEMTLLNDQVFKGKFFMGKDKIITEFFYLSEDNQLMHFPSIKVVDQIAFTVESEKMHYLNLDGLLVNTKDFIAGLDKKGLLYSGSIHMLDGTIHSGRIGLRQRANMIKSYRSIYGYYFISDGDQPTITKFKAADPIDFVLVTVDGEKTKYVSDGGIFVKYDELLENIVSKESKNPLKVMQAGYLKYMDGSKKSGFIMQANKKYYYWIASNKADLERIYTDDSKVAYVIQKVDRKLHQFKYESGKWIEIHEPTGAYSYYKNPAPTHKKTVASGLANIGIKQLAKIAASQVDGLDETADGLNDFLDDEPLEVYFTEYVVVDNKTGKKLIVYDQNEEALMGGLLTPCSNYSVLDEKEKAKMTSISHIDEAIQLLNKCFKR